ncbi:glycosyltransferase involved in cell wall biosynthesis [Methylopila capsulata]|uniref:Glycosyltransferase WbuB n=1 Tax=Methylopila capsulata TaxID=61654 RepID=A0A9W6MR22_9HYPH|nr:glycosyltransferase family 4 protein [Methylopila capsulata]MBM7849949.1 glycosyltransferase involved in cell wall biosynthesis [Methylopila capsulata]GLK55240.1 glycosyltransferase WbuB [Methylopila capsulata]
MKVIILNRFFAPDQSATSRMAASLAFGLAAEGFEVEAIASDAWHDDATRRLPPTETIEGVRVFRVGGARFGRATLVGRALDYASFHIAAAARLAARARRGDVCVVCTDPPLMSVSAWPTIAAKRAVLVNWSNDLFPEAAFDAGVLTPTGLAGRLALALRNLTVRRARVTVAPIERMAARLRAQGGGGARVAVVPHWSDGQAITPLPREASRLREEWGLSGKFVVGYSGNLGRAHDFTTVLDAASRLRHREDVAFLFVGGGHQRAWVEEEARRRDLGAVMFRPLQPLDRLSESLAAADAHLVTLLPEFELSVVPSKFYGIAAAGRPTLFVGDVDGEVAGLLRRHRCGVSVPVGASEALAAHIERLADNPRLAARLGVAARRMFDERFSRRRGLAAWRTVIESCAVRPASGAPSVFGVDPAGAAR